MKIISLLVMQCSVAEIYQQFIGICCSMVSHPRKHFLL